MKVCFQLTKEDVWKSYYYFWRQNPFSSLQYAYWPVMVLGSGFALFRSTVSETARSVGIGALIVLLFLFSYLLQKLRCLKQLRRQPEMVGERVVGIGKFDFRCGRPGASGYFHHWSYFVELVDTGKYFYFVLPKKKVLIVPQSAFADATEASRFFEQATARWQAAKSSQPLRDGPFIAYPQEGEVWPPPPRIGV